MLMSKHVSNDVSKDSPIEATLWTFSRYDGSIKLWTFRCHDRMTSLWGAVGRFSKDPVTYRARKAILESMIRLPWKAGLFICFRYKERQNNCQVSKLETYSYWRYKGIYLTRKVSGRSRNGPLDSSDLSDGQEHLGLGWYAKNSIKYMNFS